MDFLTNDKLVIVGAAGMIGSNMAQTAAMMKLTPNICLYDLYAQGVEGVYEEMRHCGLRDMNFTYTSDIKEAFQDAKYIISSGGSPRKAGMTREDLLKGNSEIAMQLGKDIKQYCPNLKHIVVIFNPADITGLVCLLYSGLKPSCLSTLAALDSIRLQSELSKYLGVPQDDVSNTRTYGGHGEQMAVFASTAKVGERNLIDLIGTEALPEKDWEEVKQKVVKGGRNIIDLRGRSSFQSPSYVSVEMIRAAMGGENFNWPVGCYMNSSEFKNVMMAVETSLDDLGVHYKSVEGLPSEMDDLRKSYRHLCEMRDDLIEKGVIPPIDHWKELNPNL